MTEPTLTFESGRFFAGHQGRCLFNHGHNARPADYNRGEVAYRRPGQSERWVAGTGIPPEPQSA